MPGELLLKARIYPISLVGIANKSDPRLEFSRENYNTWKVEIAVEALSSLLEELWKTQKALFMYNQRFPEKFQETGHDPYHIRTEWQALVPLALAVHLHGNFLSPTEGVEGGLIESLGGKLRLFREKLKSAIEAVKSLENVSDTEASEAINEFLSLFRDWAAGVANDPSQRKGYDDIRTEVDKKLSKVFPVEEVRKHIAAFASDLLRLVAVTKDELGTSFQEPINEFFSQLELKLKSKSKSKSKSESESESKVPYVSFLQRDVWFHMSPFGSIKDEDLKQFAFEFFPWILIVRYYLNKMTGNVQGSLWRELMEDPNKTLGAGAAWGSNLPALLWGSLHPLQRKEESPKDKVFAEEAISSPSAIAPRVSGATSVGTTKLSNLSLAASIATDIAVLTTGVPLGTATAEIHRRNYPGQLRGVLECLRNVLDFVSRSLEESQDSVATLAKIIENPKNPTLSSFLKRLLGIESVENIDKGQVDTFKQILQEKVRKLNELNRKYSQQQDLLRQAWVFFSEFGEIIGREVQFHEDVDEIINEIFRMFVEVVSNYRSSEWRGALWQPFASNAYRFFGSHLALSNGVPTNESEAIGSLEGAAGTRAAILRFIDTVINTTTSLPQGDKDLFEKLVYAIKEFHKVLNSKEVVKDKRGVLKWSSSRWESELKKKLKEIGLSLEEIVTSANVEDLYKNAEEFLTREKLEGIFSWLRGIVEDAWMDLADKAAERVSEVVKALSLTTMPSWKLSEWLGTLFRAARVERRTMVPLAEGLGPEESEEGGEKPVILEAPPIATTAEIEEFLRKVLEALASAHRGVGNITSLLENFAEAWDSYVAEVGRSKITIDSVEFGQIVGRVLEEMLREGKEYTDFVEKFVAWLRVKGGSIEELKRFPKLKSVVDKVLGGQTEKEEVRVEEPPEEVEEGPQPPFGSEEITSAPPDLLEEKVSSDSPSGSSEPSESEEEGEKEGEERYLLFKFVFLAKALRVFP